MKTVRPESMTHYRLTLLILILGALTAFSAMSIDMYLPAFPRIAQDLEVPLSTVQLSISAFLFGSAGGQLFYGPLADRWGRRLPLLMGLALYVLSAVGCSCVQTGEGLLIWRVVMAIGGGAGMVISRAVVRDLYTTTEAARMFSLLMLIMGAAPILAPMAGGQLLLITGWRGIFGFLGIFGLVTLLAVALFLPESLPLEQRNRQHLLKMVIIYGQLLRNRRYLCYAIAIGCVAGVNFAYIAGIPHYFIEIYKITPQQFGFFFAINAVGLIGGSQINRKLLQFFSPQQILDVAFTIIVVVSITLTAELYLGVGGFIIEVVLMFITLSMTGLLYPNVTALALAPFDTSAGSASALLGSIQYTLGATAGALVGVFHNGSAIPMASVMAACGFMGWSAAVVTIRTSSSHSRSS